MQATTSEHALSAAKIDNDFSLRSLLGEKPSDRIFHSFHPQPVTPIDERRSSFEFRYEVAIILPLAAIVKLLDGALRYNTAVVGVHYVVVVTFPPDGSRFAR